MKKHIYYTGLEGELIKSGNGYPIRLGFVGCGSHAFRNIYPCLRFLPIDLIAVCDLNEEKALLFKRQFGAKSLYTDYNEMLNKEQLDCVIVVVGFATDGSPLYLPIVKSILEKGIPVWFEKPPARNAFEVKSIMGSAKKGKTFAQVGFKKMYMPIIQRTREILKNKSFGKITTYTLRYPVDLPKDIRDIAKAGPRRFLDDFVHVASTIITLVGRPDFLFYKRSLDDGAIVTLVHKEGHIGSIHLCPSSSEMSPLEYLEIVGEGENVVINNNIELIYYKKTKRFPYGRATNFLLNSREGAEHFMPEFSLGQLYNKGLFLLGYFHEIKSFIESVHDKNKPVYAGLEDALSVMELYDSFAGKEESLITIGNDSVRKDVLEKINNSDLNPKCPNCNSEMLLKDGWNYSCKTCGRMLASSEIK